MKFGKELERDLVPEWRAKYLDYKAGKRKVKVVARALAKALATSNTPRTSIRWRQYTDTVRSPAGSVLKYLQREGMATGAPTPSIPRRTSGPSNTVPGRDGGRSLAVPPVDPNSLTVPIMVTKRPDAPKTYGSFIASPPTKRPSGIPVLELPDAAIPTGTTGHDGLPNANRPTGGGISPPSRDLGGGAIEMSQARVPDLRQSAIQGSTVTGTSRGPFFHRLFSGKQYHQMANTEGPYDVYKQLDIRTAEFFAFLDKELDKIETFYRTKEQDAVDRMAVLRQQLHEMRDRRLEEVIREQRRAEQHNAEQRDLGSNLTAQESSEAQGISTLVGTQFLEPIERFIRVGPRKFGRNTQALQEMRPSEAGSAHVESWRDFSRRPPSDHVPYRMAKKRLKAALQEYYRGLELLKAYALLNRTAFQKINKKYDKAAHARPAGRYMSEKVNQAYFVNGNVIEQLIVEVEDLYARYFERGNHKIAVGKLRIKHARDGAYNTVVFRNGLFIAAGAVLGIEGVVRATTHLSSPDPAIATQSSYLLQIYGGYFVALLLFLLFCVDCYYWSKTRINYAFVFEFDTRHNLDWRQLSDLPCIFLFLFGLTVWLNFRSPTSDAMFLYWPVLLIAVSVVIVFFPAPVIYHRSREWWAYSNFRLLLAGLYPVEFRDFLLGDFYCSLTYSMGSLALFFCLYAHRWTDADQCNSTHSRILGFLTTLPGIARVMQCLRRYHDTRNMFPHLANGCKYVLTILFYTSLSLYRINESPALRGWFIFCATINSIYTSIWDIAMDWSLGNPYAAHPFLRDVLAYKDPWKYYVAMVLDPMLRFNWIFYSIFDSQLQHSAILSFAVALTEACRRAMWALIRLENEHCTNVFLYRASRDVPLPYKDLAEPRQANSGHLGRPSTPTLKDPSADPSRRPSELERGHTTGSIRFGESSLRHRAATLGAQDSPILRGMARVGSIMATAHREDFERKRRPGVASDEAHEGLSSDGSSDEDEDEDEDRDVPVVELDQGGGSFRNRDLQRHQSA